MLQPKQQEKRSERNVVRDRERERETEEYRWLQESHVSIFGHSLEKENAAASAAAAAAE